MCIESKAVFFSSSNLIKCRFLYVPNWNSIINFFVTEGEEYKIYVFESLESFSQFLVYIKWLMFSNTE